MTLFKQIVAIVSAFVIIVFAVVMWLNFKSAKEFVQNQLYTTAQDASTSLALSLSTVGDPQDVSTMQTMINVVFDSGYYTEISLVDVDGKTLVKKYNPVKVKGVPDWFINTVKIEIPEAESIVSTGWYPIGNLHITGHAGHAYIRLWNTFKNILSWFAFLTLLTLLSLYFLLKIILKSLDRVQEQALSIIDNSFIVQKKLPFTTEFKNLVISMNKMVLKVENIFQTSAQSVQKYHELVYYDGLTKLGNRKFFMNSLDQYLESGGRLSEGMIAIFSLDDMNELKNHMQYKQIDDLLIGFAESIKSAAEKNTDFVASRISGGDFILMLPSVEYEEGGEIAGNVFQKLKEKCIEARKAMHFGSLENVCCVNAGLVNYRAVDNKNAVLSRADYALSQAKSKGCFIIETFVDKGGTHIPVRGKNEWRSEIVSAVEENRMKLAFQPVIIDEKEVIFHEEMFLRMQDSSGEMLSAGSFIAQANSFGFANSLDKHVFGKVFGLMKGGRIKNAIALNVSTDFIKESSMMQWLEKELKELKLNCELPVFFEMTNQSVLQNSILVSGFSELLRGLGYYFGIDNFAAHSENLDYFKTVKPNYLKISQKYMIDPDSPEKGSGVIESLKIAATTYDIKLIGVNIETQEQMMLLKNLGIRHLAGNIIEGAKIFED